MVLFTGSLLSTFNTQEGCNATLLCNQSGNVTWLNSAGQKIEGKHKPSKGQRELSVIARYYLAGVLGAEFDRILLYQNHSHKMRLLVLWNFLPEKKDIFAGYPFIYLN